MTTDPQTPAEIKINAVDCVVSLAKAALGVFPYAGPLLAELVGTIIPEQRIDRIAKFAANLDERIKCLEKDVIRSALKNEEFTDLLEEALRQAARSTTDERRGYLASVVANSLSQDAIEYAEAKHLLRILEELNDIEVIWLRFYQIFTAGGDDDFRHKHEEVLKPKFAGIGSPTDQLDKAALQESYRKHLINLGLITGVASMDSDGKPEFDSMSGDLRISYYHTSLLGNLLLRTIGLSDSVQERGEKTEL
jgi:hypothetical protein